MKEKSRKTGRGLWKPGFGSTELGQYPITEEKEYGTLLRGALGNPVYLDDARRPLCCSV